MMHSNWIVLKKGLSNTRMLKVWRWQRFYQCSILCVSLTLLCSTTLAQSPVDYDVIVVGAGGAGLAAATTVAEKGYSVIVLEKMPNIGGNTLRSGGYFNAVEPLSDSLKERVTDTSSSPLTWTQNPLPTVKKDSLNHYYRQMIASGGGQNTPSVVRALVEHSAETLLWLQSLGLSFHQGTLEVYGGQWPRAHKPIEPRGQGYIRVLSAALLAHGGRIETEANVKELLTNPSGRVTGVCVKRLTTPADLSCEPVYAKHAVVLASGGFAASKTLLKRWAPQVINLTTDNNPGNTGDMLLAAKAKGAALVNLDSVQVVPGNPLGQAFQVRLDIDIARSILVDHEGKRFIDEDAPRDVLSQAIVSHQAAQTQEASVFSITNQATVDTYDVVFQRDIYRGLETGASFRANTIAELARLIHVREATLETTLANYNQSVVQKDGKCARLVCQPLTQGPFWASPITMSIHSTLGGVAITDKGEVLRPNGHIIPSLYAAGEVTGNVHGKNRLGGNGITDAITYGRIVGGLITKDSL